MTVAASPPPKRFFSAEEVAHMLGLPSAYAVRRYARLGLIPSHKLGARVLFKLDEVEEALKK